MTDICQGAMNLGPEEKIFVSREALISDVGVLNTYTRTRIKAAINQAERICFVSATPAQGNTT
ncbi:uncharacterized protein N7503_001520 [Penicillium pulvis]|uniref:uncharacterized protein n=1 Tax=Penicillium pulvis TaxID=1562058 RepID=UPI002547D0D5|nr:uncharacterized protein N7503_001520 [Penicillium pulvis]KAJ5809302.1 hypothetical protein N7503_001520 [Penicillium pulvis]